jgi:hypothetical protein
VDSERTGPVYPPLPEDHPVLVYCTDDSPLFARDGTEFRSRPIDALDVGTLDVEFGKDRYWSEVMEELTEEARELGGDIVRIGEGRSGLSKREFKAYVYRSRP